MIAFIDNYDSFSYNLVRYFTELNVNIVVFKNDGIEVDELIALKPKAIILSPGPKTPTESGVCLDIVRELGGKVPILGICLGHQVIGHVNNANIIKAPVPVHGKTAMISHNNDNLFIDIPNQFKVTRYHSLIIEQGNDNLDVLATTNDGIIMAIKVKNQLTYGVQFHPEAYLTEYGKQLLHNFLILIKEGK